VGALWEELNRLCSLRGVLYCGTWGFTQLVGKVRVLGEWIGRAGWKAREVGANLEKGRSWVRQVLD